MNASLSTPSPRMRRSATADSQDLVLAYMPKAEAEARKAWAGLRKANRNGLQFKLSLDDLIQAGREGMLKAGKKFDRDRRAPGATGTGTVSFWSYAAKWVHGEIMEEIRRHMPTKHLSLVPLDLLCDFQLQQGRDSGDDPRHRTPLHENAPSMAPLMDGSDGDGAVSDRWPAADLVAIMDVITAWKDRAANPEQAGQIIAALQDGKSYGQIGHVLGCTGPEAARQVAALVLELRAELARAGFSSDKALDPGPACRRDGCEPSLGPQPPGGRRDRR